MDNLDEFFSPEPSIENEEVTTPEVVETEEVISQEPEVDSPEVPQVQEPAQEPTTVPVSALQAEREKARAARAEVEAMRQRIAAIEASQRQVPDPYDDPTGFHQQMMAQVQAQVAEQVALQNLANSRARAAVTYGEEYLQEVADWASQQAALDPNFEARVLSQPDPAQWAIDQHKRSELLKNFEADPDEYVRQRALELGLAAVAPVTQALNPASNQPKGPKSLANAKSRDSVSTINPEDDFDAIFRK